MKVVTTISVTELKEMAQRMYGNMVKADVDIEKGVVLVDMDMHADGEAYLLEQGSKNKDVWGLNLHPEKYGTDDFIEFDSMINIRPSQKNFTKSVEDESVQKKIRSLINGVVHE